MISLIILRFLYKKYNNYKEKKRNQKRVQQKYNNRPSFHKLLQIKRGNNNSKVKMSRYDKFIAKRYKKMKKIR